MASSRRSATADPVVEAVARVLADARSRWLVAFSGGLDSTVLLHAAVAVAGASRVRAIHVHHGLQPAADDWPAHCVREADRLGVECEVEHLADRPPAGASVEEWARRERYRVLVAAAERDGAAAVLTAHHADDQVETLLMRIARGTGPDGLEGISAQLRWHGVRVLRPLLSLSRAELSDYARRNALCWIEDPSNLDERMLRNALRNRLLPVIDDVAPAFRANLLRLAARLEPAREAVEALARIDLASAADLGAAGSEVAGSVAAGSGSPGSGATGHWAVELDADTLAALTPARRAAALRLWLERLGLPIPSEAKLREIEAQLVLGRGAYGCVAHGGAQLRRHRRRVIALRSAPARLPVPVAPLAFRWSGEPVLRLPGFDGQLRFDPEPAEAGADGQGVSVDWLRAQPLTATPGVSAARLCVSARRPRRTLKNLYQELGVPAWRRPALPHVLAGGRLLYAAGVGMDQGPEWPRGGARVLLHWEPARV